MSTTQNESIISISDFFRNLKDPRIKRTKRHLLHDILTIAILAMICGAEGWEDMEVFGEAKETWLRTFLSLEHGIPCADTFRRVFAAIDPKQFEACFMKWIQHLAKDITGKVVAIDGKTLRRSYDKAAKKSALHLVHAYASECQLLLGQVATSEKSNEITAIPELLGLLDIQGAIVTIDAMGCQRKIAKDIVAKEANYVLSLKGNQGALEKEVSEFFTDALSDEKTKKNLAYSETTDGDHGRVEVRKVYVTQDISWFEDKKEWAQLSSFIRVESERYVEGKTTIEIRHFISSLKESDAARFLHIIRSHWAVENNLHWSLDVALGEDACRIRKDHAPRNLSLLRKMALTMLKRNTKLKRGIKAKSKLAGWDHDFLLNTLRCGGEI